MPPPFPLPEPPPPVPPPNQQLQVTMEEIHQIIGELELVRRKQNQMLQALQIQVGEMSAEITKLREENGRLVKTDNHK